MTGPTVSLAEAARRAGVSPTTVRRWVREGRLPGTVTGPTGYAIPVAELVAAGKLDRTTPPDSPAPKPEPSPSTPAPSLDADVLRPFLDALTRELDAARERERAHERERADWQRERERLTAMLDDAYRALPAANSTSIASPGPTATPTARRWWNRRER